MDQPSKISGKVVTLERWLFTRVLKYTDLIEKMKFSIMASGHSREVITYERWLYGRFDCITVLRVEPLPLDKVFY